MFDFRFEVDDVNLSLAHYTKCFDVVHARALDAGIYDYCSFLYNVAQVMRPGGVLLLVKGDLQLYDENLQPLVAVEEGAPGFSGAQTLFTAAYSCFKWVASSQNGLQFTDNG